MGQAPTRSELQRKFHIIQPVVEKKNSRSPGCTSMLRLVSFIASNRMPPWLWTMALGNPVVPEENKIHSGCSNGTCSNPKSAAAIGG